MSERYIGLGAGVPGPSKTDRDWLDELEEALAAMTPEPWEVTIGSGANLCTYLMRLDQASDDPTVFIADFFPPQLHDKGDGRRTHIHDLRGVALLRNRAAALIKRLRAAEAMCASRMSLSDRFHADSCAMVYDPDNDCDCGYARHRAAVEALPDGGGE